MKLLSPRILIFRISVYLQTNSENLNILYICFSLSGASVLNKALHRVPEVIFQPSMLGVDQGGLAETIEFVLSSYPTHIQQELANVSGPAIEQQLHDILLTECVCNRWQHKVSTIQ